MLLFDKFESRSSRAKCVAFHPTRPWLLAGLYSSTIQLWDYRMGCIIDRFEGHQGPVRGLDIHPTLQMFVSCGDDQLLRVWSLTERRMLFALEGHQDYVRTAFFHKDLPWIVSSSDDQTIRIWDWQARKEIATLTGHNHWVSCALFHPFEDLIISSSLDCTVRAWDITGLKRRHSAAGVLPTGSTGAGDVPLHLLPPHLQKNFAQFDDAAKFSGGPPPGARPSPGFGDLDDPFGGEVVTKFIFEGHDRGVTWVACHPTQPIIVSSSDDRTLRVWRMNESRAWLLDTLRGHTDEVTGCVFNTQMDAIVSCSTDENVRLWSGEEYQSLGKFAFDGKESRDRLWQLATHPKYNLIALARDFGLSVFKLRPERPAFTVQPQLAVARVEDDVLLTPQGQELANMGTQTTGDSNAPRGTRFRLKRVHYNPAEQSFVAFHWRECSENTSSAVVSIYRSGEQGNAKASVSVRDATDAMFVSRNRVAVVTRNKSLLIFDLTLQQTKEIPLEHPAELVFEGPQAGQVYLSGENKFVLFDWQQMRILASCDSSNAKYFAASPTGQYIAFGESHDITIAKSDLTPVQSLNETIKVKSLCWDAKQPVLLYTTSSHLKYALYSGDSGILKTLPDPQYLAAAADGGVVLVTRRGTAERLEIDSTEYKFKLALMNRNFAEVGRLIETSQLVGQSIIAYLQKSGLPEIALEFVQDPKTRFDLAVEAGNLDVASQEAAKLQDPEFDERLAQAALEQGNHDLLEDVYQRQRDFDKLAFVYLATGNRSRLQRLEMLAMQRGDPAARFQTSLMLDSVQNRIELLQQAGLGSLAYALAKSNGMADEADQILADHELAESDVKITVESSAVPRPSIKVETWQNNWPYKKAEYVDIMSLAKLSANERRESGASTAAGSTGALGGPAGGSAVAGGASAVAEDDGDAWDLDEDMAEDVEVAEVAGDAAGGARTSDAVAQYDPRNAWVQNSTVPADHIAAGSFETAAQLLNRQVGVVKFDALKQRFFDVYSGTKLQVPGHDLLPDLHFSITRSGSGDHTLPFVPGLEHLSTSLSEAFAQVKANQLELAVDTFRSVLQTAVTLAVSSESEENEVRSAIETCKNYILAFSIELHRRSLPKDNVKRNLELAAYFTKPQLRKAHVGLALRTACMQASAAKNYSLASHFAAEFLKIETSGPGATKMAASKAKWDAAKTLDAVDIDFDMFSSFDIDPISLTPIYEGQPTVVEPLTRAKYHASNKGALCAITQFTEVGAPASGLRLRA